jgi:hypothetical protein
MHFRTEYLEVKQDIELFIKCAFHIENEYLKSNANNNSMPIKWYISSDSNELIKNLLNIYEKKIIVGDGFITHTGIDRNGYQRAIMDSELLSKANELIVTGGSTFGFVATMKRLKLSYFVDGLISMKKCRRMSFSDTGVVRKYSPIGAAAFKK